MINSLSLISMKFVNTEYLEGLLSAVSDEHHQLPVPDKRKIMIASWASNAPPESNEMSDILIAIAGKPKSPVSYLRVEDDVFLWLPLEDGSYKFWGSYSNSDFKHFWTVSYEFRRVLIEKVKL